MRRRRHGRARLLRPQAPRDSVDGQPHRGGRTRLDPAIVAEVVGHDDGGYVIATVYTKLGQRRPLARAQRAMDAHQQRSDAADAEPPRLTVVRDAV